MLMRMISLKIVEKRHLYVDLLVTVAAFIILHMRHNLIDTLMTYSVPESLGLGRSIASSRRFGKMSVQPKPD
jgi:hypothetical protein